MGIGFPLTQTGRIKAELSDTRSHTEVPRADTPAGAALTAPSARGVRPADAPGRPYNPAHYGKHPSPTKTSSPTRRKPGPPGSRNRFPNSSNATPRPWISISAWRATTSRVRWPTPTCWPPRASSAPRTVRHPARHGPDPRRDRGRQLPVAAGSGRRAPEHREAPVELVGDAGKRRTPAVAQRSGRYRHPPVAARGNRHP